MLGLFFCPKPMTYLSSKVWSDKARAAALAKRRGQAGPPQQSATAADAVAHANALIASGALNKKPKGGGKGKGKGAATKPKDARTPQEKTNQNRAAVAKQTGMGDLEGTVSRLSSGMHSDLEKDAHDKLISKGLAERHADGTVTLSPLGKKWKAAADKGDAAGAQSALADAQAHTADSAAKEKTKQGAATARQQKQAEHQAARAKATADRQKAAADKAKEKAKAAKEQASAKPKAGASGKDKASDRAREHADKQQAQSELSDAASALANGGQLTEQQAQRLVSEGLAQPRSYGGVELTPKGRTAAKRPKTTKGIDMSTKANRRNSAADASYHQTVHDGAVERGAVCDGMKAAARYSGSDLSHVQGMHDSSVALGAECAPVMKAVGDELAAPLDTSTDDEAAELGEDDEEAEGDGHTGLMIALQVPPDVAAELAIDGELAPEELHLTLCFLGDAADFGKQQFAILAAVEKVIADAQPLAATIGGVGRFITVEDDDTNAFYASVDCPELVDFRQSLIDALADLDIAPDTSHGFTPHITLAYVDAGAPTPGDMPTVTDLTFDTVMVAFGDHQVLFPLGDPAADEAALEAEQGAQNAAAQAEQDAPVQAKSMSDTMAVWGGAVKALGAGRVGGWGVTFGGKDLTGDDFAADTYYGAHGGDGADVLFHHGFPIKGADADLADHIFAPAKAEKRDLGIWAETVLNMADDYERLVYTMAEKGKLGWSSGAPGHMVRRDSGGKIVRWPIAEFSLTPTPAESRHRFENRVMPLKSFLADTHSPEAAPQAGRTPATAHAVAKADAAPDILIIVKR